MSAILVQKPARIKIRFVNTSLALMIVAVYTWHKFERLVRLDNKNWWHPTEVS